jgi:hypothetical protein
VSTVDERLSMEDAEDGDRPGVSSLSCGEWQLEEEHAWATALVTHGARGGGLQRFAGTQYSVANEEQS